MEKEMKICKYCNNNFTRKEHRGKQFYCSQKCAYEASRIRSKRNYKGAAYYRERRRLTNVNSAPKPKITMPKSNYNCLENFDWDEIDKLPKGNKYS